MNWHGRKVLVTGGASFIGSHLVDALLERGAVVRVVDNLSSGKIENIQRHIDEGRVEFIHADLLYPGMAQRAVEGMSVVFHLAADHGGRGYVDLHQAACATNLTLDGLVFLACRDAGVEKVVYASSGCVYPNYKQMNPNEEIYLTEDMVGPPYDADNMYGWAKLNRSQDGIAEGVRSQTIGLSAVNRPHPSPCPLPSPASRRREGKSGFLRRPAAAGRRKKPFLGPLSPAVRPVGEGDQGGEG